MRTQAREGSPCSILIIDLLNSRTPVYPPFGSILVIVGLFALAWLVARSSGWVALRVLAWHDRPAQLERPRGDRARWSTSSGARRSSRSSGPASSTSRSPRRSSSPSASSSAGVDRLTAIAGASFLIIVAGFATQRILADIIAGPDHVRGALVLGRRHGHRPCRRRARRALSRTSRSDTPGFARSTGEVIHIHNSQIQAVRVLPRGVKELAIELFVSKRDEGEQLVARGRLDPARRPDDVRPQTVGRADRRALGQPHAHPDPHDRRSGPRVARWRASSPTCSRSRPAIR